MIYSEWDVEEMLSLLTRRARAYKSSAADSLLEERGRIDSSHRMTDDLIACVCSSPHSAKDSADDLRSSTSFDQSLNSYRTAVLHTPITQQSSLRNPRRLFSPACLPSRHQLTHAGRNM